MQDTETKGRSGIIWMPAQGSVEDRRQDLHAAGLLSVTSIEGTADALLRAAFASPPSVVYVAGGNAGDILAIRALRAAIVWDLSALAAAAARLREDGEYRATFAQALARVDSVAHAPPELRQAIEEVLSVGVPDFDAAGAVRQVSYRVAVALGSGLGNMMNATPMIRWIAERTGRRVTVIISSDLTQAVQLFNDSPWIDFTFPGFEYTAGRHYDVLISTALASHAEPLCTATTWVQQQKLYDFNIHGRFIREADIYFLGLEEIFGPPPLLDGPLPDSFLRDIRRVPEGPRIIGIANGIKQGTWAKRQWPHVQALADRLRAEGWTLRCFGLPEELVAGTEDYTGLSIRDTLRTIAACTYFIGHDGGMCHIAETLGVPTLWLFGPTAYRKNGPFYSQSRIVSTLLECGPCNFKIDWLRCNSPDCMHDMSVEQVLQEFAALRENVERLGHQPVWAPADPKLIDYELKAITRPSRVDQLPRLSAERGILYPRDPALTYRMAADLLRFGDFQGAESLVRAMAAAMPSETALRAVHAALAVVTGSTAPAPAETLHADTIVDILLTMQLSPAQFRTIAELLFHAEIRAGRIAQGLKIFERIYRRARGALSSWGLKQWVRALTALAPESARQHRAELLLLCRNNKGLLARLNHGLDEGQLLAEWSEFLGEAPAETPLAAGRRTLLSDLGVGGAPVSLRLPAGTVTLNPWSTVLLLVPACDPTISRPGAASAAIVLLARRLAAAGLCPVVASASQATERPYFEFRDNVTYVHGSLMWSQAVWDRLAADLNPALVLSSEGMQQILKLRFGQGTQVLSLSARGLYDPRGLAALLSDELSISVPPGEPRDAAALSIDDLMATLPQPVPGRPRPGSRPGPVYLLVNDLAHLDDALALPRRCPQMKFVILADGISRGVDPNIRFVARRAKIDWDEVMEGMSAFVQFSPERADLCVEALAAMKAGVPVIAATPLAEQAPFSQAVVAPANPGQTEEWVALLRRIARERLPVSQKTAA